MVRYLNVFFTTVHLSQPTTPEQRMGSPSAARREAGQSRLAALHTPCASVAADGADALLQLKAVD